MHNAEYKPKFQEPAQDKPQSQEMRGEAMNTVNKPQQPAGMGPAVQAGAAKVMPLRSDPSTLETAQRRSGARGTAAMDVETRQAVARKGGMAVSQNKQHMADIGRKGGQTVSRNRDHMAAIGRKGGEASRKQRKTDSEGGSGST